MAPAAPADLSLAEDFLLSGTAMVVSRALTTPLEHCQFLAQLGPALWQGDGGPAAPGAFSPPVLRALGWSVVGYFPRQAMVFTLHGRCLRASLPQLPTHTAGCPCCHSACTDTHTAQCPRYESQLLSI